MVSSKEAEELTGDVVLKPFLVRVVVADVPPVISDAYSSERITRPLQCQLVVKQCSSLCSIMVPLG